MSALTELITKETMRAHRVRWYVYTGRVINGVPERILRVSTLRGPQLYGYDVVCSCGWDSRLGGGVRSAVEDSLWNHRWDEQNKAQATPKDPAKTGDLVERAAARQGTTVTGKTYGEMTPTERRAARERALGRLQQEFQANSAAIGRVLLGETEDEQTFTYRLPDGSDDVPDEHGRHTKTVNVRHSAKDFLRFPGCEHCRSIAEHERVSKDVAGHYPPEGEPWYTIPGSDERFTSMGAAIDANKKRLDGETSNG